MKKINTLSLVNFHAKGNRKNMHSSLKGWALTLSCLLGFASFGQWQFQGPGPSKNGQVENITDQEITGAIHAVTPHPSDASILYVGSVNGGIWKTTDAGATKPSWTNQTTLNPSLSIGALEFDPLDATNQTLVAGIGNFSSYYGSGSPLTGILRTTNGGASWTAINGGGALTGRNISGLAVHSDTIILSVISTGIWRSTNLGANWTQVSGAGGSGIPIGTAHDLIQDPNDAAHLITNINGTLYDSDNAGGTWTAIADATLNTALPGFPRNVRLAYGSGNNVYIAIANGGSLSSVLRSGNDGVTWTAMDVPLTTENAGAVFNLHPGNQAGTHFSLAADPNDANIVYIGGDRQPGFNEANTAVSFRWPNSIGANDYTGRLFRIDASLVVGNQVSTITHVNTANNSSPHGDSRDMSFDANGDLIEGDDGGVYKRVNPELNNGDWFSLNGDLSVTEFHNIAWDSRAKMVIGGAQDNGTPQQDASGNDEWTSIHTGDGGDVAVDDISTVDTSVRYSSFQNLGSFRRRVYTSGNGFVSQTLPALNVLGGGAAVGSGFFITPTVLNGSNGNRLLIANGNGIYESLDQGDNVTLIAAGVGVNNTTASGGDIVSPLAYGTTDNVNVIYAGVGTQVRIRTGASPAALTNSAAYNGGTVADIALNPGVAAEAIVIDNNQVFRTTNTGSSWPDVTGNLMALNPGTLHSVVYSTSSANNSILVGGDNGVFIANGPAFNVWTELGVNLPNVKILDMEYDAEDDILVVGTLGRGAWSISLEERDPIDIGLVLDISGSMGNNACGGCSPKIEVLKDAVEIFVNLWTVFAIPDDRFGVTYFESNVDNLTIGGNDLIPVQGNAEAIIADIKSQTDGGGTSMGGGLQSSINDLQSDPSPDRTRNIILFTDGMQNVNPMVNTTGFNLENEAGRSNSNISPTTPETVLDTDLEIKVNTIGVGATDPFVDLLDDIADETDGLTKITTAPDDDLRKFYVEELVDALRGSSPQLVDYRYSTTSNNDLHTESVSLPKGAKKVIFKLSWKRGTGGQMYFSVRRNGQDMSKLGQHIVGEFYQIFSIDVPRRLGNTIIDSEGDWDVQIRGGDNVDYELAIITDQHEFNYDVSLGDKDYKVGQPVELKANLEYMGHPVHENTKVTATIYRPKTSIGTLLATDKTKFGDLEMTEPGISLGQQKLENLLLQDAFRAKMKPIENKIVLTNNGNGSFTGLINNTEVVGNYIVKFTIEGNHPAMGEYTRVETVSTMVEYGETQITIDEMELTSFGKKGEYDQWQLMLQPIDRYGNYLGPDYGNVITVVLPDGNVEKAIDKGDGTYIIPLETKTGTDPIITILVKGDEVYKDRLQKLNKDRRFALSAHLGATVPLGTIKTLYDASLMFEVDAEYRITPLFSAELVGGIYAFKSKYSLLGGTLYAKKYFRVGSSQPYLSLGGGYYDPISTSQTGMFGASAGAGFQRQIRSRVLGELGVNYFYLFPETADVHFLTLKFGFKYTF